MSAPHATDSATAPRVRAMEEADLVAVAAITNHYIATSAIHFAYDPIGRAELRSTWDVDRRRFPWLVAVVGETVVGYAKAGVWRTRSAYDWTAEVAVYVAPDQRGRGVGRLLYAELLDGLRRRGFRSAIGGVTLPNDASVALHERFGFVSVGVVREAGFKRGAWHDVEFFQKMLDHPHSPT